jgi:hypothetical protein
MRRSRLRRGDKRLERSTPLRSVSQLKARQKRKPLFDERAMREVWHDHVLALAPKRRGHRVCPVCDQVPSTENPFEAHHVLPKAAIKKFVAGLQLAKPEAAERLARLLWDFRNGLPVCRRCHSRHTSAYKRITIVLLTRKHRQFARELGLEHLLEQTYDGGRYRADDRREAA